MNRIAGRAGVVLLLALLLVAGFSFFLCEYLMQSGEWVISPGSPHIYEPEGSVDFGVVTDRNGTILMDMRGEKSFALDSKLRMAMVHWLGDREGNVHAPILPQYAKYVLSYDAFNGVYQYGKSKGVISTTISGNVQKAALDALGDYKGTVAVYNYRTGELICAVSTPTFDPDFIPDIGGEGDSYEGAYLNRFTQSTYIPGSIFKIVTLAAALENIPDIQERTFNCTGTLAFGNDQVNCGGYVHHSQSLKNAFRNSCNCAFAQIALELGAETLDRYIKQFGVIAPVTVDGLATAAGNVEVLNTADVNLAWSGVGQHKNQINPCAFLTFVGAIANDGKGIAPYFVQQAALSGTVTYTASPQSGNRIMNAATAKTIQEYMRYNVTNKYGSENFPDLAVCAKTGTAEVDGDKKPNAMLAGFVADEACPLAFIACVEDAGYGITVCIPLVSKILEACKTEILG